MPTSLLVATTNPGKLREILPILAGLPAVIRTLADFPDLPAPEETGETFAENARLKALYYSNATGLLTAAEDSGLEIDALDGAPGVHSARFNGGSYPDKFAVLYGMLEEKGAQDARARFIAYVVLAHNGQSIHEVDGRVEGTIAPEPRGSGGFGYDPILFYPPFGRTMAELSAEEKASVSHRGQAFRGLRGFLESYLST